MKKIIFLLALFFSLRSSYYILPEGKLAIITQFGRPVGESPHYNPCFYLKLPFIQVVSFLDKRILDWDGTPKLIPTKENENILVDTTARWKIIDALKYLKTLENQDKALEAIERVVDAATRNVVLKYNRIETIRDLGDENNKELSDVQLKVGREKLTEMIFEIASKELKSEFGIELIDVQLKRIFFENV